MIMVSGDDFCEFSRVWDYELSLSVEYLIFVLFAF